MGRSRSHSELQRLLAKGLDGALPAPYLNSSTFASRTKIALAGVIEIGPLMPETAI
jgi:hypothetical protein